MKKSLKDFQKQPHEKFQEEFHEKCSEKCLKKIPKKTSGEKFRKNFSRIPEKIPEGISEIICEICWEARVEDTKKSWRNFWKKSIEETPTKFSNIHIRKLRRDFFKLFLYIIKAFHKGICKNLWRNFFWNNSRKSCQNIIFINMPEKTNKSWNNSEKREKIPGTYQWMGAKFWKPWVTGSDYTSGLDGQKKVLDRSRRNLQEKSWLAL